MSRAKYLFAVVAVTTVLCADQAVPAAPLPRPHVAEMAARLIDRLSQPFRRSVPNAIRVDDRRPSSQSDLTVLPNRPVVVVVIHHELCAFQFRLPPPLVG